MKIKEYLERINYAGDLTPSIDVLQKLHKTHLLNVPFENLDIHYGNPIELDIDKLFHKVVTKKRGGFCYELNGLFQALLTEIGFQTKIVSARVYHQEKFGAEYDHLAIIVNLNQIEYLVDVGFGEFLFHPLKLELNSMQSDPRGDYIIEEFKDDYYKVSKIDTKEKTIKYIFTQQKRAFNEFNGMCIYHQTDLNSHFTQNKLISKPTENGRISISGDTLKITEKEEEKTTLQLNEENYAKYLLDYFDIEEAKIKASN